MRINLYRNLTNIEIWKRHKSVLPLSNRSTTSCEFDAWHTVSSENYKKREKNSKLGLCYRKAIIISLLGQS